MLQKYKSSPGNTIDFLGYIYDETGETKQFPRTVSKTISINGEKYTLSKDEINDLQKEIGTNVMNKLISLIP